METKRKSFAERIGDKNSGRFTSTDFVKIKKEEPKEKKDEPEDKNP